MGSDLLCPVLEGLLLTGQAGDAARFAGLNVISNSRGSRSSVTITSQPYIARARGEAMPGCCLAAAWNTDAIIDLRFVAVEHGSKNASVFFFLFFCRFCDHRSAALGDGTT